MGGADASGGAEHAAARVRRLGAAEVGGVRPAQPRGGERARCGGGQSSHVQHTPGGACDKHVTGRCSSPSSCSTRHARVHRVVHDHSHARQGLSITHAHTHSLGFPGCAMRRVSAFTNDRLAGGVSYARVGMDLLAARPMSGRVADARVGVGGWQSGPLENPSTVRL